MAALLPLLLLPLLLPPGPALGNEGAAAGSCKCRREAKQPPIVKHFPDRLLSCQTCPGDMLRFKFPHTDVCGHKMDSWALSFWHSSCNKTHVSPLEEEGSRKLMRTEASMPGHTATPASYNTVPPETAPCPGTTDEAPGTLLVFPDRTTDVPQAPGRARSTPLASGDPAEPGPSRLSLQEEAILTPGAGGSQVVVMMLIGMALGLVAVTVLVVCKRRHQGQGRSLAHYPGEEMRCLPCKET